MANKYEFDKDIFKSLNADSSWVLGWILSDGCVCNNRLSIGLSSKDEEVLIKIKDVFKYKGNINHSYAITNNKKFNTSSLSIYNKELLQILEKYEVFPRKSLTLLYPKLMNWLNMRHFVRGYFEGDGCVTYNRKRNYVSINFKGTLEFLKRLKFNLNCCLGINGSITRANSIKTNVYDYNIAGNKAAIMFLNWIYSGAKERNRLNRKYNRAKELYNLMISKRHLPVYIPLAI